MAKRIEPQIETFAKIKVVGIGGAGGSAINRMIESGVMDVEFIAINTDAQALHHSKAPIKVNIGPETTRGLGAGGDPKVGQDAALESLEEIKAAIADTDILFLTFGAGGGTGSGAAHIVAKIAREMGILVVAFVTKPFGFEVDRRARNAEYAISNLEKYIDTLVIIPNDNLLNIIDTDTPLPEAFKIADDVLRQGIQGITDLITVHGLINLDFADVKSIMKDAGQALMSIGRAGGENRAEIAAQQAINSPLLNISINGAKGVLFNVIGGNDMTMHEINRAAAVITEAADQDVNVIFGATINPDLDGEIIVTVVATGFNMYPVNRSAEVTASTESDDVPSINKIPDEKLKSVEDLPSLSTKKSKSDKVDDPEDNEQLESEDITRDVTDDTQTDEVSLIDDDETPNLWDDIDTDEDDAIDLNKPTILRKLAKRRQKRKERKLQEKDELDS
ncbi:MAG: cell division protein FtsZ [Candidatus Saccharibacteria bacterium]|nr:cell division protein FtsZ [Candidatus Saccharibacteria bacterium]MCY4010574.1 cell division protein FtsZ [Candidatus Saccharibacteria bacterium]MCY4088910.1 cell division protein FtsZ [Candidatus Saccharibacteria bacterium]